MPRHILLTGRPGLGQVHFPEDAKEAARLLGLTDQARVLVQGGTLDAGGAPIGGWTPGPWTRARIDERSAERGEGSRGDQQVDAATHTVTLDADVEVTIANRIEIGGKVWAVIATPEVTDRAVRRVEVVEA